MKTGPAAVMESLYDEDRAEHESKLAIYRLICALTLVLPGGLQSDQKNEMADTYSGNDFSPKGGCTLPQSKGEELNHSEEAQI